MTGERFGIHVEGFQWKIEEEFSAYKGENVYQILTTHNGYQWSGGSALTLDELHELYEGIGSLLERTL